MKLILNRIAKKKDYTIGKLYIDGKYFCDTLEDTDRGLKSSDLLSDILRNKIKGLTAIPIGTYQITMNVVSPKFKDRSWAKPYDGKIPRLLDVPGFEGVLLHPGNTALDSIGCLLLGLNKVVGQVINSVLTFHRLMAELRATKDKITIAIK